MTYTPNTSIVEKLNQVETTIRVATIIITFILSLGFAWTVGELQELQSADTIEVVEDE